MKIPRVLIYEDRMSLEEFGINDALSPNRDIYEKWLLEQPDLEPFKAGLTQRRLQAFNDAYYICTIALMHHTGSDFVTMAYNECKVPAVTFPLIYLYLSRVPDAGNLNKVLLKDIKAGLKSKGWEKNLKELQKCVPESHRPITASKFERRGLTPELLSSINWYEATEKYSQKMIQYLISHIAMNEEECTMMLDAIEDNIKDYEREYNRELDFILDEESGTFRMEEPIDMTPQLSFCDELRGKYSELSPTSPANNEAGNDQISEQESVSVPRSKGRQPSPPFEDFIKEDAPDGFLEILEEKIRNKNPMEVAKIITACTNIWIRKPDHISVIKKFGVTSSCFYSDMTKSFDQEELDHIRAEIQAEIER